MSHIKSIALVSIVVFGIGMAHAGEGHSHHQHQAKKQMNTEVHDHSTHEHSQDLLKSMDVFLDEYMKISEFLAADNFSKAQQQAVSLDKAIHALKHKAGSPFRKQLKQALHTISSAKNITTARKGYFELSKIVIPHVKMMGGLSKGNLYYCPMALNGKGAQWMQKGTKTRNPYYGSQMLGCGSPVK
ncbi:MAG: DUF3347 domain-containing protein [Fibrobacterales bacterium]